MKLGMWRVSEIIGSASFRFAVNLVLRTFVVGVLQGVGGDRRVLVDGGVGGGRWKTGRRVARCRNV